MNAGATGVDHKWRLTQVSADGKTTSVPESITATVQFTADGQFLANDSVNAVSGTWRSTPSGYRVVSSASTLVGYAGHDATKLTVIAATDAVTATDVDVAARSAASELVLTVRTYTLTFADAGPATTFAPASPTTTRTSSR